VVTCSLGQARSPAAPANPGHWVENDIVIAGEIGIIARIKQIPVLGLELVEFVWSSTILPSVPAHLQSERAYSPFASYAFSKLLNNVTAVELQRRINRNPIPGRSDSVVAVHPGIADTELSGGFFKSQGILWLWFLSLLLPLYNGLLAATKDVTLRTTNSAANTVLFASLAPSELVAGAYVVPDAAVTRHHRAAYDEDTAKQMWDYAAELTGLQIDPSLS